MTAKAALIGLVGGALLTALLQSFGLFPPGPRDWADVRADLGKLVGWHEPGGQFDTRGLRR